MDVVENSPATGSLLDRWFGSAPALRGWTLANLLANIAIIITGAVVRLSASGLGCDTWPRCSGKDYTAHPALGWHSYVEFGNRLLTFVLIAIAVGTVLAASRNQATSRVRLLAWVILLGIPFQGVIGGITVRTHLNPWVVALHLVLSVVLVVLCTWLLLLVRGVDPEPLAANQRLMAVAVFWTLMLAIWLGTVVTGAGPHAGDLRARRNNVDILMAARVHALCVWVAVGFTVLLLIACSRRGQARARRWVLALLGAELLQGAIGYAQFFTGLPMGLVILHMTGIGLVTTAASWLFFGTRRGMPDPDAAPSA